MKYDYLIIGAGIVGLATAFQLKKRHPNAKICVLEKEKKAASHQTGNNSGVVHSGIYYKPGSHKARNCIEGREELLQFCDQHDVPYKKLGKLIVATKQEELPKLQEIFERGNVNSVKDLALIGVEKIAEIEPHVQAIQAIHVPHCHVINYASVAEKLAALLVEQGGEIFFEQKVEALRGTQVSTQNRTFFGNQVINCAGLHSDRIARLNSNNECYQQQILPFRGEYYELKPEKRDLVNGLIYPVPDPKFPFLGVHLTRMIDGKVEAGPNAVLSFAREGYRKKDFSLKDVREMVCYKGFWQMAARYWDVGMKEMYRSFSKKAFLRDLQKLMPCLNENDLVPGGVGIRAQVVTRDGKMLDDFSFERDDAILHVLNAPSPAATASFSIGRYIASLCE